MQDMNRSALLATAGLVALIGIGIYAATTQQAPAPVVQETSADAPTGKLMSVEAYVTQNISAISPIKETMGGTFYVTEIEIEPERQRGNVKYEDGHNAYEANFTYISDDRAGHTITSFVIAN